MTEGIVLMRAEWMEEERRIQLADPKNLGYSVCCQFAHLLFVVKGDKQAETLGFFNNILGAVDSHLP